MEVGCLGAYTVVLLSGFSKIDYQRFWISSYQKRTGQASGQTALPSRSYFSLLRRSIDLMQQAYSFSCQELFDFYLDQRLGLDLQREEFYCLMEESVCYLFLSYWRRRSTRFLSYQFLSFYSRRTKECQESCTSIRSQSAFQGCFRPAMLLAKLNFFFLSYSWLLDITFLKLGYCQLGLYRIYYSLQDGLQGFCSTGCDYCFRPGLQSTWLSYCSFLFLSYCIYCYLILASYYSLYLSLFYDSATRCYYYFIRFARQFLSLSSSLLPLYSFSFQSNYSCFCFSASSLASFCCCALTAYSSCLFLQAILAQAYLVFQIYFDLFQLLEGFQTCPGVQKLSFELRPEPNFLSLSVQSQIRVKTFSPKLSLC